MRRRPCPNRAGCAGIWVCIAATVALILVHATIQAIVLIDLVLFMLAFFSAL